EMSSQAATSRFRSGAGWLAPLPGVSIRVMKGGELAVKGPSLFLGYWENGKWRRPFDARGYFHTGDLGQRNARGEVRILGRRDGLIISGGENIQPEEIENSILKTFPVLEVIVVGVPDAVYGARPAAFIKWKSRMPVTSRIRQILKEALPSFKIPDFFWEWPSDENEFKTGMKWSRPAFASLALEKLQVDSSPK
ncbi:MAG: AMP-binding protein, partial [Spirochaetia bacterium]|nr:AMP-binding protein [Spirochaetia bacterium]